ncbi:SDR family oxidoreductase [Acidocella sp.]|jgi:nucleoside-diphosphate-sugar epimerase|uniref:SDR family oxidoreductase n=1 Tax=Acidocella sp. TaxID=50710 RepID=UPI002F4251C2
MLVFVTGATGCIGSASVSHLLARGHRVLGLTRSEAGATALKAAGASPHFGSLQDLESLRRGARQADAVLHLAFEHDFTRFSEVCALDKAAIEVMCAELEGSGRAFISSSGVALVAPGGVATEDSEPLPVSEALPRFSEHTPMTFVGRGVAAGAVRFAPSVHGREKQGLVTWLIQIARQTGVSAYVGDGENVWPAVQQQDAAELCALAVEKAEPGARWHAVGEEGVPLRAIAEAIGRGLGVPVVSKAPEEAVGHFGGWIGNFVGLNIPASSRKTRETLGWQPRGIGLIEELDRIFAR